MTVAGRRPGARARWMAAALAAMLAGCGTAPADGVLVFAAASLRTALDDMQPDLSRLAGVEVRVSYAGSPTLARQIESGAPADVFIPADAEWMDYLEARGAVQSASRVNVAGNGLVLVAPAAHAPTLAIAHGFPLAAALGDGRLAMADPDVPAGRYGRAALMTMGVWDDVADRIAPGENVRAALLLVARGEAPLGVVYRTDAHAERRVAVVDTFPAGSHPPIVYPAALTATAAPAAARVLEALRSSEAAAAFSRHGFAPAPSGP